MLNEEIELSKFNTSFEYNKRHPKEFFRGNAAADRLLLPIDKVLWKCSDFGISPSHTITEWWVLGEHLEEVLRRCSNLGISVQRYCRDRYAVIWEWKNAMAFVVEARLKQPVYGFGGQTKAVDTRYSVRGQDTGLKNIALIGGDPQLCIPNLTTSHIEQINQRPSDLLPLGWHSAGLPQMQHPPGTVVRGGRK
jgi:hypothetical protein